ncbi:MAG: hypothetical protein JWQ04_617 [Pedosphaera sp.]|nr:hypothetical protein [Pedosphaera sp.]
MKNLINLKPGYKSTHALTLLELVVIIAVIAIAAGLFLPATTHSCCKAVRIKCVSNLKQVGLAFRIWSGDNGDHFPMTYTNSAGVPLYADPKAFLYFQVMSNELSNPQVLICPDDEHRRAATNFTTDFDSTHISYFVGLDSDETRPQSFLAGDSHIMNGAKPINGLLEVTANQPVS